MFRDMCYWLLDSSCIIRLIIRKLTTTINLN
jgi:hypothetical protein